MGDARFDELRFLARLEREGLVTVAYESGADHEVRIATHLLQAGLVNDGTPPRAKEIIDGNRGGHSAAHRSRLENERWQVIEDLHCQNTAIIYATHAAAVRRAELEQSLQRDRLRDPTGILWDSRYAKQDLQIALWAASEKEPVVVAYLDMNGLKSINDTLGHAAGDAAIRAYVEVVGAMTADKGDAYRGGQADEILVVLPATSRELGTRLLGDIMRGISATQSDGRPVTAAAGLLATTDPAASPLDVRKRADKLMYLAKAKSKQREPWCCTLAVEGRDEVEVFEGSS